MQFVLVLYNKMRNPRYIFFIQQKHTNLFFFCVT